jgi:hypothetical protein
MDFEVGFTVTKMLNKQFWQEVCFLDGFPCREITVHHEVAIT